VRLTFLGTRGEISRRSSRHERHTTTLVQSRVGRILIDAGLDWTDRIDSLEPDALVLTHAHPDHVGALRHGSPCPVYAPAATWMRIGHWPIRDRSVLRAWQPCEIGGVRFEAVPVAHSVRAPAVGYRLTAGGVTAFYVPDIAALPRAARALAGVSMYIGDGAAIIRPILRRRDGRLIGHAAIASQLDWCRECQVTRAIFTHCGSEIVRVGHRRALERISRLGRERGVRATIASDGDRVTVA
jgi:phosphoribosyl 1,2-cyclic phosphodiesterase